MELRERGGTERAETERGGTKGGTEREVELREAELKRNNFIFASIHVLFCLLYCIRQYSYGPTKIEQ